MSLESRIKSQLTSAMKERKEVEKNVLRVVLGDTSTLASRSGKALTDDEVAKVIRKVVQSNEETMGYMKPEMDNFKKLHQENVILKDLLPKTLTQEEIQAELNNMLEEIKVSKNDGQATGICMKYLKTKGVNVLGDDVKAVVANIRK